METIQIKYLRDITPLTQTDNGDWIDLRSGIDINIKKDELTLIPLGIAMKLPDGYEAIIAPRSSSAKKFGFIQANSIGIIDETYCGNADEWCLMVYGIKDTHIEKDTRICQFRIIKHQPKIIFQSVTSLSDQNRGGFGSTGNK